MVWEPTSIRPIGRAKITQDDNLGFQRVVRRFVVEGPEVSKTGLCGGTAQREALFRPTGEPDVEFDDHYLIHQYVEPSTSMDKAVLVREFAQLRDTWTKESTVESTEMKKLHRNYAVLKAPNDELANVLSNKKASIELFITGTMVGKVLTLVSTNGASVDYTGVASSPVAPQFEAGGTVEEIATSFTTAIETSHAGKLEVCRADVFGETPAVKLTINQSTSGSNGNSVFTSTELTNIRSPGQTVADGILSAPFIGGTDTVPSLGYDRSEWDLLPKQGQISADNNDPWDFLPKIIQDTEPTTISYEDKVPAPVTSPTTSADTALRIVWARHVLVTEVSGDGLNVKLKVEGVTPYRLGTQPASGVTTYIEENNNVTVELGSRFMVIVDPRVTPSRSVDIPTYHSLTEDELYSTYIDSVDPRYQNNEINNLDIEDVSGFVKKITLTPIQSMFAGSKGLIGLWQNFDFTSTGFLPDTAQFLEDYVNTAALASPIKWLRASITVDTSNPGVDLWTVSWAAPVAPFWRTAGTKSGGKKGPSVVNFTHNGLSVLRPQVELAGSAATFTWYNVGKQVALFLQDKTASEPSVSLDFHLVGAEGNGRTQSFKQTFANAVFKLDTSANLKFPTQVSLASLDDRAIAHAQEWVDDIAVAYKAHRSLIFTYRDPDVALNPMQRPLYQGRPLQSAGGHITWNNQYNIGGSFPIELKISPIYSHNKDRIWRIEATFM